MHLPSIAIVDCILQYLSEKSEKEQNGLSWRAYAQYRCAFLPASTSSCEVLAIIKSEQYTVAILTC